MKRLMTVPEVADTLIVSEKSVRRLVLSGELEGLKVRNCLRITAESIRLYQQRKIIEFQQQNGIIPLSADDSGTLMDRNGL